MDFCPYFLLPDLDVSSVQTICTSRADRSTLVSFPENRRREGRTAFCVGVNGTAFTGVPWNRATF